MLSYRLSRLYTVCYPRSLAQALLLPCASVRSGSARTPLQSREEMETRPSRASPATPLIHTPLCIMVLHETPLALCSPKLIPRAPDV